MKRGRASIAAGLAFAGLILAQEAAAQAPDGQAVYRKECKSCHGAVGTPPARAKADYPKIRALGDSGFVARLSEDSIVVLLKKGIDKDMKSFAGKLNEAEMRAVARYLKELATKKSGG